MASELIDNMEGLEVSKEAAKTQPLLNEEEERVLKLYDRLEELQLEIALLKAQGVLSSESKLLGLFLWKRGTHCI